MGSDLSALLGNPVPGSFNSRSRMGSDCQHFLIAQRLAVSIRAPAWGATHCVAAHYPQVELQFALPHGERQPSARTLRIRCKFQFALPHGERPRKTMCKMPIRGFNSRSRMGSDAIAGRFVFRSVGFNSRSRMGSDCHHAMTGTACIESALFASQAGKVLWGKMQFVYHVFKSISIHHAISAANTPAFR